MNRFCFHLLLAALLAIVSCGGTNRLSEPAFSLQERLVVGTWLYFVAGSQLPKLNQETGEIRDHTLLEESEIRRVRIGARE
jgi:hypothetical protein